MMTAKKSSAKEKNITADGEVFRLLFDDHPIPMVIYHMETLALLRVNNVAVERYGYSHDEYKKMGLDDILPAEETARLLETLKHHSPALRRLGEWKNRLKGGDMIDVEVTAHALQFEGHKAVLVMAQDITERKRAVEALRINEERFETIFNEAPLGIALIDSLTGRVVAMNPMYANITGMHAEQMTELDWLNRTHPDDIQSVRDHVALLKTGKMGGFQMEKRYVHSDGRVVWVTLRVMPVSIRDQTHPHYLAMITDITERRQTEETFFKLKKAVDTSTEAVFLTDTNGVFTYVNPGFTTLYGYNADEVVGKVTPRILKSGLLASQVYTNFWKTLTGGREAKGELINKRKNGKLIDIEGSASPILDDAGRIIGYLGIQRDISPRKQAEDALRVAEENYHSIFENATVGIYQSVPQGRFISVNPTMARIFGYASPADMLDGIASIETQYYVDPADRREFQRILRERGETHEFCSWAYRKDGSHIWIQENARAVKDAHGNIRYYEGFVTDITEQKRAEDSLHRAKESLEEANRELENVLAREQHLARTDGLTGLYNYRYFFEVASHEFNIAMRYQHPLSILMFDADGFKQINDSYGHLVGDAMLSKMAETVAAQMRTSDVLARYGGDEFVILLSHSTAQQAFAIAERIRQSIESLELRVEQAALSVTLSIGVADLCWEPKDDGIERIVQRADQALYAAKQAGRNCTAIFEQE